jgi:hypothetical protein
VTGRWSDSHPYDLTRTQKRASVPKALGRAVPERPGTYVIFRTNVNDISESIIDIGEMWAAAKLDTVWLERAPGFERRAFRVRANRNRYRTRPPGR